jgi:DNA-binding XRE family transcriptional regulator
MSAKILQWHRIDRASRLISIRLSTDIIEDNTSLGQYRIGIGPERRGLVISLADYWARQMTKQQQEYAEEIAVHRAVKSAMRHFREMRGWTHNEMASFLNITKGNYQKYEFDNPAKKLRKVPMAVALRFCEYTGQNIHDLVKAKRRKAC